jgi:hypothetical protein
MDNPLMTKHTIERAFQMVQHKYGPMDKKLFLRMFPDFGCFLCGWGVINPVEWVLDDCFLNQIYFYKISSIY